jgi:dolichol-phosphate mannosyltransferase
MLSGQRVGVIIPAYNEAERLGRILPGLPDDLVDLVVVIADGCTDSTAEVARGLGATVIEKAVREGPGPGIRDGLRLLQAQDVRLTAVMAANGKHDPGQVPELLRPLVEEGMDLVRGSRYLRGGYQVNMPWHRRFLIRLFTLLLSLAVGQRVTDGTGGFQAYRLAILDDRRIDLDQPWLGRYEVETYLFVKTLLCGYRWKEVPVRITYPGRGRVYTRARPLVDWWGYFRPVVLLRLGLRR